jgi:methyl-accepting chemotaxis protein
MPPTHDLMIAWVRPRDTGGGRCAMMKDVSAPIPVAGRHWGGLRLGYKV